MQTSLFILFQWLSLKSSSLCTLSEFLQCALSDDGKSLRRSLYSFIILTEFVSIDPEKNNHFSFVGPCVVFLRFSSRTVHTERTIFTSTSGPMVNPHISLKKAEEYNAKTTCRSLSQDNQPVHRDRLQVHLHHRYNRTLHYVQQ